jgi:hypothetical protein
MAKSVKVRARSKQPTRKQSGRSTNSKRSAGAGRETKQSRAIALLRSAKGATIDALMNATGWQQHSVRGFLAGVVRKRLKLQLDSSIVGGRRVYHLTRDGSETGGTSHTPSPNRPE